MLTRLKLTAIRDQLDSLLDKATRRELTLREALTLLCEAEVARKDERRIQMAISIAKFPFVRTLEGFEFAAQPSLDPKQIRELATCRWVGNGEALLLLGPPASARRIWPSRSAARRSSTATRRCSPPATGTGHGVGQGASRRPARGAADALRQAQAADRRRTRLPAVRGQRRAPVLPAGIAAVTGLTPGGCSLPAFAACDPVAQRLLNQAEITRDRHPLSPRTSPASRPSPVNLDRRVARCCRYRAPVGEPKNQGQSRTDGLFCVPQSRDVFCLPPRLPLARQPPTQRRYASIHSAPTGLGDGSGRSRIGTDCRSRPCVQIATIVLSRRRSSLVTFTTTPSTVV